MLKFVVTYSCSTLGAFVNLQPWHAHGHPLFCELSDARNRETPCPFAPDVIPVEVGNKCARDVHIICADSGKDAFDVPASDVFRVSLLGSLFRHRLHAWLFLTHR